MLDEPLEMTAPTAAEPVLQETPIMKTQGDAVARWYLYGANATFVIMLIVKFVVEWSLVVWDDEYLQEDRDNITTWLYTVLPAQFALVVGGTALIYVCRNYLSFVWSLCGTLLIAAGYILYASCQYLDMDDPVGFSLILASLLALPTIYFACTQWSVTTTTTTSRPPLTMLVTALQGLVILCHTASLGIVVFQNHIYQWRVNVENGATWSGSMSTDNGQERLLFARVFEAFFLLGSIIGVCKLERPSDKKEFPSQNGLERLAPLLAFMFGGIAFWWRAVSRELVTGWVALDWAGSIALAIPLVYLFGAWTWERGPATLFTPFTPSNGAAAPATAADMITSPVGQEPSSSNGAAAVLQHLQDIENNKQQDIEHEWWESKFHVRLVLLIANALWFHVAKLNLYKTNFVLESYEAIPLGFHSSFLVVLLLAMPNHECLCRLVSAVCLLAFVVYFGTALWYFQADYALLSCLLAAPHAWYLWMHHHHPQGTLAAPTSHDSSSARGEVVTHDYQLA